MLSRWIRISNRERCLRQQTSSTASGSLLILGLSLVSSFMAMSGAHAAQLTRWSFNPITHWLTLTVPGGTSPQYFLLAQPPRIVVDLPNTQVDNVPEVITYSGMVQSVRVGQFQPELTRIVIEFEPNITFAPGHITIQPGSTTRPSEHGNREVAAADTWYIRPLLVGQEENTPVPPTVGVPSPEAPLSTEPSALSSEPIAEASFEATEGTEGTEGNASAVPSRELNPPPLPDLVVEQQPSSNETVAPENLPGDFASRNLPPLEPGALEIPVEIPEALPPTQSPRPSDMPVETEDQPLIGQENIREVEAPVASVAPSDPPVAFTESEIENDQPSQSVSVEQAAIPSQDNRTVESSTEERLAESQQTEERRTEDQLDNQSAEELLAEELLPEEELRVPPSNPDLPAPETAFLSPIPEEPPKLPNSQESQDNPVPVITFGQSFSPQASNGQTPSAPIAEVPNSGPVQTSLTLRYPRDTTLAVSPDHPRQEVLVVTQSVRDRAGVVVIPEGSLVIGQFEQIGRQLRFTPKALTMGDRTIRLDATSVELSGDTIEPNQQIQMPLDSAIWD